MDINISKRQFLKKAFIISTASMVVQLLPALSYKAFSKNNLSGPISRPDELDDFVIVNGWVLKKMDVSQG